MQMNDKFKLANKPCGYSISSIIDTSVKVTSQILARKIMRKCRANEVLAPIVFYQLSA